MMSVLFYELLDDMLDNIYIVHTVLNVPPRYMRLSSAL
jgi:hypothetical protein